MKLIFEIIEKYPQLSTWLLVSLVIFAGLSFVGGRASLNARAYFALLLTRSPDKRRFYRYVIRRFIVFFDGAFGVVRISRNFFYVSIWRSMLSTLVCLTVVLLFLASKHNFPMHLIFGSESELNSISAILNVIWSSLRFSAFGEGNVAQLFIISFLVNFLADYLSILETRVLLRFMLMRGLLRKTMVVLMDFLITTIIVLVAALIANVWLDIAIEAVNASGTVSSLRAQGHSYLTIVWLEAAFAFDYATAALEQAFCHSFSLQISFDQDRCVDGWTNFSGHSVGGTLIHISAPFILTTYLTSVWLWLYALAVIWLRVLILLDPIRRLLNWFFNARKQPFFILALLATMFWSFAYLANVAVASRNPNVTETCRDIFGAVVPVTSDTVSTCTREGEP